MEPDRLAKGVAEDVNTSRFQRRAGELGQQVGSADKRMEQHLQEKFQHKLGKLQTTAKDAPPEKPPSPSQPPAFPATTAAGLAALLADTQNARQAIILSEILRRPEERWT